MAAKAKNQRLALALVAMAALIVAALLAMSALKDQASYFYTPGDAARDHVTLGRAIRLGGMVERGSLTRGKDGVSISFRVTDGAAQTAVRYTGIVPDLFREGSGVVADGRFVSPALFVADTILAKHDEKYMPPEMAGAVHKSESLK